jgi:hypothetical protein
MTKAAVNSIHPPVTRLPIQYSTKKITRNCLDLIELHELTQYVIDAPVGSTSQKQQQQTSNKQSTQQNKQ